jgi:phage host-nuclease inhibitor protein Gam
MPKQPKPPAIKTREELEATVNDYAAQDAVLRGLKAELDVELAKVRDQYAARVSAAEDALKPLAASIEEWAILHPGLFLEKKSLDLIGGRIGFRISPPSVKTLRGVQEETAVDRVMASQWAANWTRDKIELARDTILADYASGNVTEADLKNVGLRVSQTENFFIEPAQVKV